MFKKPKKIVNAFPDVEKDHAVGVDEWGREVWYMDLNTGRVAWRHFDRKGNVIYYFNTDGEEIIRKFNRKGNLIYSNDCNHILVDKRKTKLIREKFNKIKWKIKYREPLKFKIKYLINRIRYRKQINEALKK